MSEPAGNQMIARLERSFLWRFDGYRMGMSLEDREEMRALLRERFKKEYWVGRKGLRLLRWDSTNYEEIMDRDHLRWK